MNVLFACTLYPPAIGGAEIHLHRVASQVQSMGHQVSVVTSAARNRTDWLRLSTISPEPRQDYVYQDIPVHQIGYGLAARARMLPSMLSYYFSIGPSARRLGRLMGEQIGWPSQRPDVVHVSRIGREFLAGAALRYARDIGVPYVLTPNHHPRWRGYLYTEYDRIYREADAVLALTDIERQSLIDDKGLAPENVHVTGIGPVLADDYSADEFREKYNIRGPFVLYLGQQFRYKGVGSLVEAAPQIFRKHPDVKIVVIGPTTKFSERLFAGVKDPRLINLGAVDLRTKTSALAACEFLCLPSCQESFGGVFVEAWSMRKAVIGGRIPPIACVIDDGHNGLLSSQDPDELAAAVNRLLSDRPLSRAMGDAGWAKVQAKYTWESIARKTLDVYEQAMDRARRRGVPAVSRQPWYVPAAVPSGKPGDTGGDLDADDGLVTARSSRTPAKVLLCHNFYKQRGGEDQSFEDEAALLQQNGHQVIRHTVHSDATNGMSSLKTAVRSVWNNEAYHQIRELIRRERPAVVHCTNTFPLISPSVYYAAHAEGVPVVQALRNYRMFCPNVLLMRNGQPCEECLDKAVPWPGILHGCYHDSHIATAAVATMLATHRLAGTWSKMVDLYYTLTDFSRTKFIQGGLEAERVMVKPNFVRCDEGPGAGDGGYAVFAGRLSQEKGISTLLAAWAANPDLPRLKIIGTGALADEVQRSAARCPNIEWLGWRPLREVMQVMGSASCLIMPSIWYETFGRTIMEAFAKGVPVIASRLGAMAELVRDGITGALFQPGNATDLADKVKLLLGNPARLAEMRRNARQEYEQKYTPESNYLQLMRLYDRALSLFRSAPRDAERMPRTLPLRVIAE